ncbi:MAG TPA: DUF2243 domain-containing protein [Dehalococcoidia bacterium]|nr:DUF2243 domain-containing protein [Dehalococcoidia bacterium]
MRAANHLDDGSGIAPEAAGAGARSVFFAALVLGVGIGGFIDGIVLHQLLQWHHMVSSWPGLSPEGHHHNLEVNVLWDGLFHAVALAVTVAGVWMLTGVAQRYRALPATLVAGGLIAGWGVFNLIDSIVNHFALRVHHIYEGSRGAELTSDVAFLVFALALIAGGYGIARPLPGERDINPA